MLEYTEKALRGFFSAYLPLRLHNGALCKVRPYCQTHKIWCSLASLAPIADVWPMLGNIMAGGEIIGNLAGGGRRCRYFLKDHLGSVRTTVDRNGNVVGRDDYYPFGLAMPGRSSNTANPNDDYKFTGYEKDDEARLTMYHANARDYDPVLGRFMQIDPLADQFPAWNPYHYVHNNPLNLTDPTGMAACDPPDDCPTEFSEMSSGEQVGASVGYELMSLKHAAYNLISKPFFGKRGNIC